MSTIDSRDIVLEIIQNDGVYPGDPRLFAVYSYINDWQKQTYSILTNKGAVVALLTSPFVHSPKLLWDQEKGITPHAFEMFPELNNR